MYFKKKVYIGETENLLARLGKHSASLKQNKYDCRKLQEDWNQLEKEKFSFHIQVFAFWKIYIYIFQTNNVSPSLKSYMILNKGRATPIKNHSFSIGIGLSFTIKHSFKVICFGDAYSSQIMRRKKEKSVIQQKLAQSFLLYNIDKSTSFIRNYQRKIEIDGKIYSTIIEAATDPNLGISETTIRRRFRDPKFLNYKDIQCLSPIYRINKKFYKTLDEAKKDNVGGNRQTIKRRINSIDPKWSEWQKLSDD